MMIEFLDACLGAIHEFVNPEYIPLVDAITAPTIVIILVLTCSIVSAVGTCAVVRALWSGVRRK